LALGLTFGMTGIATIIGAAAGAAGLATAIASVGLTTGLGVAAGAAGLATAVASAGLATGLGVAAGAAGLATAVASAGLATGLGVAAGAAGLAALVQSVACMLTLGGCTGYVIGGFSNSSLDHIVWDEADARKGAVVGAAIQGIAIGIALGYTYWDVIYQKAVNDFWFGEIIPFNTTMISPSQVWSGLNLANDFFECNQRTSGACMANILNDFVGFYWMGNSIPFLPAIDDSLGRRL
jgi:hypothetical protein